MDWQIQTQAAKLDTSSDSKYSNDDRKKDGKGIKITVGKDHRRSTTGGLGSSI